MRLTTINFKIFQLLTMAIFIINEINSYDENLKFYLKHKSNQVILRINAKSQFHLR
jgi:hypothetical protein